MRGQALATCRKKLHGIKKRFLGRHLHSCCQVQGNRATTKPCYDAYLPPCPTESNTTPAHSCCASIRLRAPVIKHGKYQSPVNSKNYRDCPGLICSPLLPPSENKVKWKCTTKIQNVTLFSKATGREKIKQRSNREQQGNKVGEQGSRVKGRETRIKGHYVEILGKKIITLKQVY